jgi:hypothetical protein
MAIDQSVDGERRCMKTRRFGLWALTGLAITVPCVRGQNTFPATGNVGIGTASPASKLQVVGAALVGQNTNGTAVIDAYNGDAFFGDNTSTNGIAVNSSGFVGIGTTTPIARLTLSSASGGYNGGQLTDGTPTFLIGNGNQRDNTLRIVGGTYENGTSTTNIDLSNSSADNFTVPTGFRISSSYASPTFTNSLLFLSSAYNGSAYTYTEQMRINGNGNLGIGTTTPGAKLEVNGSLRITAGSGASLTFADGTVQSTAYTGITCGGDYAESVDLAGSREQYSPGDLLAIDPNDPSKFHKSGEPYSTSVAGIFSTRPGTVGRRQTTSKGPDEIPMAVVGIVPAKVSTENGPIRPGDLLVSSATPGFAMKGTDRMQMLGAVVGKAMGALDSGRGAIEVLVTLQ